jgi:hypothetical protein
MPLYYIQESFTLDIVDTTMFVACNLIEVYNIIENIQYVFIIFIFVPWILSYV